MPIRAINIFKNSAAEACLRNLNSRCVHDPCVSRFRFRLPSLARRTPMGREHAAHRLCAFDVAITAAAAMATHSIISRTSFLIFGIYTLPGCSYSRIIFAADYKYNDLSLRHAYTADHDNNKSHAEMLSTPFIVRCAYFLGNVHLHIQSASYKEGMRTATTQNEKRRKEWKKRAAEEKNKKCHRRCRAASLMLFIAENEMKETDYMRSNPPCAAGLFFFSVKTFTFIALRSFAMTMSVCVQHATGTGHSHTRCLCVYFIFAIRAAIHCELWCDARFLLFSFVYENECDHGTFGTTTT